VNGVVVSFAGTGLLGFDIDWCRQDASATRTVAAGRGERRRAYKKVGTAESMAGLYHGATRHALHALTGNLVWRRGAVV
jgi:hypothetical protein